MDDRIGAVAIGRNEGVRLEACLKSLDGRVRILIYVDSGSTDGSQQLATAHGAELVQLDCSEPFTAARARNAGAAVLLQKVPSLEFIQFLDGDCQLVPGWLEAATDVMDREPKAAVVCGRRRERFPDASRYNRLCDMEWNTPIGEARSCGGDALIRASAFQQVSGFDASIIAGEEPELCVRLREEGWKIFRIDKEMTIHDAAMFHFWQWWQRMKRAGHAYAEGAARHGAASDRHYRREVRSIWLWGLIGPLLLILCAPLTHAASLLGLLAYPLWVVRIAVQRRRHFGDRWSDCGLYGLSCMLGKFPQMLGQLTYWGRRLTRRPATVIEYKGPMANKPAG